MNSSLCLILTPAFSLLDSVLAESILVNMLSSKTFYGSKSKFIKESQRVLVCFSVQEIVVSVEN